MADINPGDLIREKDGKAAISRHAVEFGFAGWKLLAKGPGWRTHNRNPTNPAVGEKVQAYSNHSKLGVITCGSQSVLWERTDFYRVVDDQWDQFDKDWKDQLESFSSFDRTQMNFWNDRTRQHCSRLNVIELSAEQFAERLDKLEQTNFAYGLWIGAFFCIQVIQIALDIFGK